MCNSGAALGGRQRGLAPPPRTSGALRRAGPLIQRSRCDCGAGRQGVWIRSRHYPDWGCGTLTVVGCSIAGTGGTGVSFQPTHALCITHEQRGTSRRPVWSYGQVSYRYVTRRYLESLRGTNAGRGHRSGHPGEDVPARLCAHGWVRERGLPAIARGGLWFAHALSEKQGLADWSIEENQTGLWRGSRGGVGGRVEWRRQETRIGGSSPSPRFMG